MSVTELRREPDADLVSKLKQLLKLAESGTLRGLVVLCDRDVNPQGWGVAGEIDPAEITLGYERWRAATLALMDGEQP